MMTSKQFSEMSFEEVIEYAMENYNDFHIESEMREFVKSKLDKGYVSLAHYVLHNMIADGNYCCDYYFYDFTLGEYDKIVGIHMKEEMEQFFEKREEHWDDKKPLFKRKVLINGMIAYDALLIITDIPEWKIEEWCKKYANEEVNESLLDYIKDTDYYYFALCDSEIDSFKGDDLEIIGYEEYYDLLNYCNENEE